MAQIIFRIIGSGLNEPFYVSYIDFPEGTERYGHELYLLDHLGNVVLEGDYK